MCVSCFIRKCLFIKGVAASTVYRYNMFNTLIATVGVSCSMLYYYVAILHLIVIVLVIFANCNNKIKTSLQALKLIGCHSLKCGCYNNIQPVGRQCDQMSLT